jgi:urease accessory protein
MERVVDILTKGDWSKALADDSVRLRSDDRFRRRKRYVSQGGRAFLLDLPAPRLLRDGDGLVLFSGAVIAVEAEDEDLLEVASDDAAELARLAWHLGNRHAPVELAPGRLRLRDDGVMRRLLENLGLEYRPLRAGFDPETNSAAGAHSHSHDGQTAHDRVDA